MQNIRLRYGGTETSLKYEEARCEVLSARRGGRALSDREIDLKLDAPIGSDRIDEVVQPGESVLIVVPDATREVGCGQIVNLLVRRLIANGTAPFDIRIIFATGIHRKVTHQERESILTPFIAQRIKMLDHDPRDIASLVRLGETSSGIPVEVNRALKEHDRVIMIGGVSFHYFAGFTGGRKSIVPGLASNRTVAGTHKLAFDMQRLTRRDGVDTGVLDGNAVHEAFVEAVKMVDPDLAITTMVDDDGAVTDVFLGDWNGSHRAACDAFAREHTVEIEARRPLVVASCGGIPHDIDLIQAHKSLDAASRACADGGTIVLLAECGDGTGRADLMDWFAAGSSAAIAEKLRERYQVNGQTAWNFMRIAERFDVRMMTRLNDETLTGLHVKRIDENGIDQLIAVADSTYILPKGARINIVLSK